LWSPALVLVVLVVASAAAASSDVESLLVGLDTPDASNPLLNTATSFVDMSAPAGKVLGKTAVIPTNKLVVKGGALIQKDLRVKGSLFLVDDGYSIRLGPAPNRAGGWNALFGTSKGKSSVNLCHSDGTAIYSNSKDGEGPWNAFFGNSGKASVHVSHKNGLGVSSVSQSGSTAAANAAFEYVGRAKVTLSSKTGVAIQSETISGNWNASFRNQKGSRVFLAHRGGMALHAESQSGKQWTGFFGNQGKSFVHLANHDGVALMTVGKGKAWANVMKAGTTSTFIGHPNGHTLYLHSGRAKSDNWTMVIANNNGHVMRVLDNGTVEIGTGEKGGNEGNLRINGSAYFSGDLLLRQEDGSVANMTKVMSRLARVLEDTEALKKRMDRM
jgi:hypothetical protein